MDIHSASCSNLLDVCGRAMRITLNTKRQIIGNCYTIDPETRSVVIVEFKNEQPEKLVMIPGDSIQNVELLIDDEINASGSCVKQTADLDSQFANMFKPPVGNNQSVNENVEERKKKIEEVLQKGRVRYELDSEASIIVGAVKIKHPYLKENCISTNNIALSRIMNLLKSVF